MKYLRFLALAGIFLFSASHANAQRVAFGVGFGGPAYVVGPGPVCAYGYYGYYPYACAPYGYYGSDWFVGGVFIGAGPWFHGFYGRRGYGFDRPGFAGRGFGFNGRGGRFVGPGGRGFAAQGGFGRGFSGGGHGFASGGFGRGSGGGGFRGGSMRGGFHGGGGRR
jgi:hypothetical protein